MQDIQIIGEAIAAVLIVVAVAIAILIYADHRKHQRIVQRGMRDDQ